VDRVRYSQSYDLKYCEFINCLKLMDAVMVRRVQESKELWYISDDHEKSNGKS